MSDLFSGETRPDVSLGPGAKLLAGFAEMQAADLVAAIIEITQAAPFRHLITPGGWTMSVAMTNCGALGWVSDRSGYRYDPNDPQTGRPWPALPPLFLDLAQRAAAQLGFTDFRPDACLVNRYVPGSRLTLHQDRNERGLDAPIVSVSLGLPATFLWGGLSRADKPRRFRLIHGDVVVWGGPSRMTFHGIDTLPDGDHPMTGALRYNLTFRRAG